MSEFKHPFKHMKLKNKSSEDKININKQLACDYFCARVTDIYEGKE